MPCLQCPYCVHEGQFRPMIELQKGHYRCENCGHIDAPDEPGFNCNCKKCLRWRKTYSHRYRHEVR
jgi:hypothetical protein